MNAGPIAHLQEIDADLARDYDRVNRNMGSLEPRVGREFMDDIDVLVDRLLGKLSRAESEAREAKEELCELKNKEACD